MKFILTEFVGGKESNVVVTLDSQCNVLLMDDFNFSVYRRGMAFQYLGGWATQSPVSLTPTHHGHWNVIVDLGGRAGTVKCKVNIYQRSGAERGDIMETLNFDSINITGIVEEEIGEPRNNGTRGNALYPVPFRLSRTPPAIWEDIFIQIWNHPPRYTSMHRPGIAHVIGDKVILDGTTIEEVEKYHKETLKLVVDETNRKAAEYMSDQRHCEEQEADKRKRHREHVSGVAKRIKFD